jgi:beta-lactamase regulating signal transducer with metallopeptidase domain
MTLPYLLRLLCLCFSFFFLLNAACGLLVCTLREFVLRFAGARPAASAANFLLVLRLLPCALAALFVLALCVPSYVRLEPAATAERVGFACLLFGGLGLLTWSLAVLRVTRALVASAFYRRRLSQRADKIFVGEHSCTAFVLDGGQPVLALAGVVRPCLLVSRSLLQALSPEEFDAAVIHETAHRASRDNLKRLLVLLAPEIFPFLDPLRRMEQAWSRFAEWAADDRVAAGNSQRAVSLASALLRVARLGAPPALPYLSTSLLASDRDLQARVDRLLQAPPVGPSSPPGSLRLRTIGLLSAMVLSGVLLAAPSLAVVHELQELLLR